MTCQPVDRPVSPLRARMIEDMTVRGFGDKPPSMNTAVSALRFLFTVTLYRPDLVHRLTVVRQRRSRLSSTMTMAMEVTNVRSITGD